MNFTKDEKLAIGKALFELVMADGKVTVGEVNYMAQLDQKADISPEIYEESISLNLKKAMTTLRNMSTEKKAALVVMLNEMAFADGTLADEEVEVVTAVWAAAGIKFNRNGKLSLS